MIGGIDALQFRKPEHDVETIFPERWSPRAMSGEPLAQAALDRLLEAARWAPSSFNGQPWRFVYAHRDTVRWPGFLSLLSERNELWCARASVLLVLVSRTRFEHNEKPARTHALDTGAAWASFALQGARLGLVVHGMAGFDYERAAALVSLPEAYAVQAMIAVGHPGSADALPEDMREKEKPSGRKPIAEISMEGGFAP